MRRLFRFFAFVALAALGFAVLRWAIGDNEIFRNAQSAGGTAAGGTAGTQNDPRQRPRAGEGIPVQGRDFSATVRINGGFRMRQERLLPDGTIRTVYTLQCENCEPVDDVRHRLTDVRVGLFDQKEHVADLTAASALVELRRDGSNKISLAADKEIELRDAVLATLPGGRLAPMRLVFQVVRAQVREDEIELHTPGERDPVELTVGGSRPLVLRGLGFQGRLPKDREGNLQRFDIDVLHDPDLRTEGVHLWANGRLSYVEDPRSGTVLVHLEDAVQVELSGQPGMLPGDQQGQDTVRVSGDRLTATLLRTRTPRSGSDARAPDRATDRVTDRVAEPGGFRWRHVQLDGGPASAKGRGIDLRSPRLLVLPGPEGQPWLFSATGGDSRLVQAAANGKGETSFAAKRRIHHIRPGDLVGATLRQFGFPGFAVLPLDDLEIAVLEGSVVVIGPDGERIEASNGMRVLRPDPRQRDTELRARGFGDVAIHRPAKGKDPALEIRGNDGFLLVRTEEQTVFDLGPREPSADHEFDLRRGDLHLHGHGEARITEIGKNRRQLRIRSPQGDLSGTIAPIAGELQAIRRLDADLTDQEILSFEAEGERTTATLQRGTQKITVSAPSWRMTARNCWQLRRAGDTLARATLIVTGADGAVQSTTELTAPLVDLYHLDGRNLVIVADADDLHRAHVVGTAAAVAGNPVAGDADLVADRIRMVPFAVAETSLDVHFGIFGAGVRPLLGRTLGQPWMFATGRVVADLKGGPHGDAHGEGATLIGSLGGESCLLIGDHSTGSMAVVTRAEPGGRTMTAIAPRVRLWRSDGEYLSALTTFPGSPAAHPIEIALRDPRASRDNPLSNLRGVCSGSIDVLPTEIRFNGPVVARGLDANGREAADGLRLSANELNLQRSTAPSATGTTSTTGEISLAKATGGVALDWNGWRARSDELVLDLPGKRCSVTGERGAEIEMRGLKYQAKRLEADYGNYTVRSFRGSLRPSGVSVMPQSW